MSIGILFSLLILVLIVVALWRRRQDTEAWLREERYEESGSWIEKRSGERGTYGRLDAKREAERLALSRKGRIADLALEIRNYCLEHLPAFQAQSDAVVLAFSQRARRKIEHLFDLIEETRQGKELPSPSHKPDTPHAVALKKQILTRIFEQYPWLLDWEIPKLKQLDAHVLALAHELVEQATVPNP
ncbi:MAG: hypothetical protein NZM43_05930 [Saprospiraceae bacterium]|nr:hypothetical protein [Saprospiraceae bacterium]MDW8483848.1 hypothetical protein [Saprospiraceae bacterium]